MKEKNKQTKALALRSCSRDDKKKKKGEVINAALDFDNTVLISETNDGIS